MNTNVIETREATELSGELYADYAQYVIETRALPSVYDGMKAVQRRLVYVGNQHPKRFVKSVAIVGDTSKLHPHGDASIYGTLVSLTSRHANQFPLFQGKGNWGGPGFGAAAQRYTEAYLSELARKIYCSLVDYAEFVDGEAGYPEPRYLPAFLPYAFLSGSSGIGVGLSTNIFPLNPVELTEYYIAKLKGEKPKVPRPDFGDMIIDQPREEVEKVILSGYGRLVFQGVVIREDTGKFVIENLPPDVSIHSVLKKVQSWIDQELLDFVNESTTTPRYVFEIRSNKLKEEEVYRRLVRAVRRTKTYNFVFSDGDKAVYCGLDHVVESGLNYLRQCTRRKFADLHDKTSKQLEILKAIEEFKKSGKVKDLPQMSSDEVKKVIMDLGFSEEIASEVPKRSISYLTRDHGEEMKELEEKVEIYKNYRDNPDQWLLLQYESLLEDIKQLYSDRKTTYFASECLQNPKAKLVDNKVVIGEEGIDCGRLLLVTETGMTIPKVIQAATSVEMTFPDIPEKLVGLVSSQDKYIVYLIRGPKSDQIFVTEVSNFSHARTMIRMDTENYKVYHAFTTNDETIKLKMSNEEENEINLPSVCRSRFSYPIDLKYRVLEVVKQDGDEEGGS